MNGLYVVTGASGSMGSAAVRDLVSKGDGVIMACRNLEKGEKVRKGILEAFPEAGIVLKHLELESFASVVKFCKNLEQELNNGILGKQKIDGLFNNAGVLSRGFALTEDCFERTIQVNYLSPWLLTRQILPLLSEGGHIVNMVSLACRVGNICEDFFEPTPERFNRIKVYSDTKVALLLSSIALGRQVNGNLHVNVADPGIVDSNMISMGKWFDPLTDILFRPLCNSPEKGVTPALNALHTDCHLHYFVGKTHKPISSRYMGNDQIDTLEQRTEELMRVYL